VESHGFKVVREARKELVAQIERVRELEEVIQALGGGEEEKKVEEKVEETTGEEQVEKAVVEDVIWEINPLLHLRKCQRGTHFGRRAHGVLLTATLARGQIPTSDSFRQQVGPLSPLLSPTPLTIQLSKKRQGRTCTG